MLKLVPRLLYQLLRRFVSPFDQGSSERDLKNRRKNYHEILTQVFQFLSPIDRRTCQFVCKSWNLPAKQVYFSSIITSKSGSLSNLLYSLKINGSLVQSLVINWNIKLHSLYFHQLLSYCPRLITLCLNEGYVEWLSISLIELNMLKVLNMEGDTLYERAQNDMNYYRTAYRFCSSLEEIEIVSPVDQDLFREFGGVTKYLSNFKNLKRLKFDGGDEAHIYLSTLLNTCKELNKSDIHLDNSQLHPPIVALNRQVAYNSSMRQLKINLTKFSIEHLQYLVDKYIYLSKLYVHIDDQQYLDWRTDEDSVRSFMKSVYFPFLNTLTESSFAFNTDQSIIIRKISTDILNSFDKLKTVCCRFKKDVRENASIELKTKLGSAHLNMTFLHSEHDFYSHYGILFCDHGHLIKSLEIDVSDKIYFGEILRDCHNLESIAILTQPQRMSKLFIGGPYLYTACDLLLHLSIDGSSIPIEFFSYVSSYAPNLRILRIINCYLTNYQEKKTLIDLSKLKSLSELQLQAGYDYKGCSNSNDGYIVDIVDDKKSRLFYYPSNKASGKEISSRKKVSKKSNVANLSFGRSVIKVQLKIGKQRVLCLS